MPHGTTTHLIPISHVPYSQEEYHHQILVPLQTRYPYGYSNVPSVISSTPINIDTNIKTPGYIQTDIPVYNHDKIRKYDRPDNATTNDKNNDHNLVTPIGLPSEEPVQINYIKDDSSEELNPLKNEKLLNNKNYLSNSMTMETNQTNKLQDLLLSNKADSLEASMPLDTNESSQLISKNKSFLTDDSNSSQLFSQTNAQESYFSTTTEHSDTTIETKSEEANNSDFKEASIIDNKNQLDELREVQPDHELLNNKNQTTDISVEINIIEKISTTQALETETSKTSTTSFTSLYPTTTQFSTTLCENNDCQRLNSSNTTASVKTTIQVNLNNNSIQKESAYSTTPVTKINDEYVDQLRSINSLPVSQISTTVLETTTLPYENSKSTLVALPSLPSQLTSMNTTHLKLTHNTNNATQSIDSLDTLPTMQIQKNIDTMVSTLAVSKTEPTSLIARNVNYNANNTEQKANNSLYHDELKVLSPTTTIFTSTQNDPIARTLENNLSTTNITTTDNYRDQIYTTTKKLNVHTEDTINYNFPITTKEPKKDSLKLKTTTIKPHSSIQKPISLSKIFDDSKQKISLHNQNRILPKTEPPQTQDDSELWYSNQMNTQNLPKKELNKEQLDFLLKKLVKLLKPEIEKETLTNDSVTRFVTPKLGNQDKLIYIIFPWVKDATKNMENEENTEVTKR